MTLAVLFLLSAALLALVESAMLDVVQSGDSKVYNEFIGVHRLAVPIGRVSTEPSASIKKQSQKNLSGRFATP